MSLPALTYHDAQCKVSHNAEERHESMEQQLAWDPNTPWQDGCSGVELDLQRNGNRWEWSIDHDNYSDAPEDQLRAWLIRLREWSDAHPGHRVITVTLDIKNPSIDGFPDAIDTYLRGSFPADRIFTPGELMGDAADLVTGAQRNGWPELTALAGRFVFEFTGDPDSKKYYAETEPKQRLCFVQVKLHKDEPPPGTERGHRVIINVALEDDWGGYGWEQAVRSYRDQPGFIVRCWTANDSAQWSRALAAGINLIATDQIRDHTFAMVGTQPHWRAPNRFWSEQARLPGETSEAPGLAASTTDLLLLYRAKSSSDLYAQRLIGGASQGEIRVTGFNGAKLDGCPAVAWHAGQYHVVYRRAGTTELWWFTTSGSHWSTPVNITAQNGAKSEYSPALADFAGVLHLVYKDLSSPELRMCTLGQNTWNAPRRVTDEQGAPVLAKARPALLQYNKTLHLYWQDAESTDIWCCKWDGEAFRVQKRVTDANGARTSRAPAAAVIDDELYVLYRAASSSDLWACHRRDQEWSGQICLTDLRGMKTDTTPAMAACGGILTVVFVGEGGSNLWTCNFAPG